MNSYIGIFFIIIGLLIRVDFKFSIQKDFKYFLISYFLYDIKTLYFYYIFMIAITIANIKKAAVKLLLNGGGGEI